MYFYFLIIIADVFLAASFGLQKKYQKCEGTSLKAGLVYNTLMGFFSTCMFLILNKFHIEISLYSVLLAIIFSVVVIFYTFIGFRIIEKGNVSLYTIFLMSGGMTVPYVWGVAFLREELTFMRTIGLVTIIAATVISGSKNRKFDKKQIMMCVAVFLLNGVSSVVSKMHQISDVSNTVTATDFAFIVMLSKCVICSTILLFKHAGVKAENKDKIPFKNVVPIVFVAAIFDGISYMLQLVCATEIPATVLYPMVTGISVILSALVGTFFFKEQLAKKQYIGIGLCFIGTLLFL